MPPKLLMDISDIDLSREAASMDAVREANPQRFEFEQLTRVVHIAPEVGEAIGVREIGDDEFWIRGHIPGRPLFPGVLMCEAAAQLGTYLYKQCLTELAGRFVGFGGLDKVRFRGTVQPGDTLILVAKAERIRARQGVFQTQGLLVKDGEVDLVFEARVIGVPMPDAN